jgi:polyisoprenoid-binding protein YceI
MLKLACFASTQVLLERDEHIKKEQYLDVGHFADMQFVTTKVVASAKSVNEGVITGKLIMHGVTRVEFSL